MYFMLEAKTPSEILRQIRRLLFQASKYDLQTEAINIKKQLTSENLTIGDRGAKSFSIYSGTQRGKLVEQRKIIRVEDAVGKVTSMAQHNVFSYFESKRSSVVGASITDWASLGLLVDKKINVYSMFCLSVEAVSLKFTKDGDSLEHIIHKIGALQSHLSWLKTRFKRILSETDTKNYSDDILKLYDDILTDMKCFDAYIHDVQTLCIVLPCDSHVSSLRAVHASNPRFVRGMDDKLVALVVKRTLSGLATIHKFGKHHTRITVGEYAARDYNYKCAEVLSVDAFFAIEDAGLLDTNPEKETGQKFRKTNRVASELNHKVPVKGMTNAWFRNIPILVFDPGGFCYNQVCFANFQIYILEDKDVLKE